MALVGRSGCVMGDQTNKQILPLVVWGSLAVAAIALGTARSVNRSAGAGDGKDAGNRAGKLVGEEG
jgi:hypothetical protein